MASLMLVPRPVLSGPEQLGATSDNRFLIHYTAVGADAVDPGAVGVGLNFFGSHYLQQLGMRPPLPDDGGGGDSRVDVYLHTQTSGERGQTVPVDVGKPGVASCWIEIDPRSSSFSGALLEAVAGHEAMHCVQLAYTTNAPAWLKESCSAYVEHKNWTFDLLQQETNDRWAAILAHPEIPLETVDGTHEYVEQTFVKFLVDRYSGPSYELPLRAMWDALGSGADPITAVEQASGHSIAETLAEFGRWNLYACGADDGLHYDKLGQCTSTARASPIGLVVPSSRALPLAELAVNWISVPLDPCDPASALFDGSSGVAFAVGDSPITTSSMMSDMIPLAGSQPVRIAIATGRSPAPSLAVTLSAATPDGGACPSLDSFQMSDMMAPTVHGSGCSCAIGHAASGDDRLAFLVAALFALTLLRRRRVPSLAGSRGGRAPS